MGPSLLSDVVAFSSIADSGPKSASGLRPENVWDGKIEIQYGRPTMPDAEFR